jgi:hypothetical protein
MICLNWVFCRYKFGGQGELISSVLLISFLDFGVKSTSDE